LSVAYIVVADRTCQIESAPKQHGQYHDGGHGHIGEKNDAAPILAALDAADPPDQKRKAERWVTKFFCEAKALDVALVLFTYCLVIVTGWLVYATAGLREETATLAQFARQQPADMKASIDAAQKSAAAATSSAETAERALVLTDRAWIEIELEALGPLRFSDDRIEILARGTFKNVGNSPATHVQFYCKMCPDSMSAANESDDAAHRMRRVPVGGMGYGRVLFPGKDEVVEEAISVSVADFVARIKEIDATPSGRRQPPRVLTEAFLPSSLSPLMDCRVRGPSLPSDIRLSFSK
jgi:hypothetical protein